MIKIQNRYFLSENMLISWAFCIQLFLLLLGNSLAWEGCANSPQGTWRCGDACIHNYAKCQCGNATFGVEDQTWCCHKSCAGKGKWYDDGSEDGSWSGAMVGDKIIGAECTGRELNLTQACDQKCNYYPNDTDRNRDGILRSHMPCDAPPMEITECLQEDKMMDGKYDCRNRADEEAFQTGVGNTSSLLLDLEQILIPCIVTFLNGDQDQGFKCSNAPTSNCLRVPWWCNPRRVHSCNELKGTTATGKTIDPQLCSNQSFWDQRSCGSDTSDTNFKRCTGDAPGRCGSVLFENDCMDGSDAIELAQGGNCGDDLRCRARGPIRFDYSIWKNKSVCIEDQYKCDGVIHCRGGEDEVNCTLTATEKCECKNGYCFYNTQCDKAYKGPDGGHCVEKDDLLCRARDGKWAGENICLKKKFLCDNYVQCEDGKDEVGCEGEYLRKRTFPRDHRFICRSPFLEIRTEENKTGKFFPIRAIRLYVHSLPSPYNHHHHHCITINCTSGATQLYNVQEVKTRRIAMLMSLLVVS